MYVVFSVLGILHILLVCHLLGLYTFTERSAGVSQTLRGNMLRLDVTQTKKKQIKNDSSTHYVIIIMSYSIADMIGSDS